MKFSASLVIATVSALLFTAMPTQACEQSCRDGIALAFCNKYAIEWNPMFDKFGADLKTNFYNGLTLNTLTGSQTNTNKLKSAVDTAVSNQVKKLKADYTKNCQAIVLDSIFLHEPKFKGPCQRPLKVNQPPAGVAWTMDDCNNQDYICGNPPAICHFMDKYVKPRNIKLLTEALTGRCSVDGDFPKTIGDVAEDGAKKANVFTGSRKNNLATFLTGVKKNIRTQLDSFVTKFSKLCTQTTCDKYDAEIKQLLLTFP